MALTKVRPPVSDISEISFTTSSVVIPSAGGDINIDVAGVNIMDLSSTTVLVDPAITLEAELFSGEQILLDTVAGAGITFETQGALARLLTTTAHPLELGANSITGLTIATDGKVELDVDGTAANHLVDKDYVDTQVATATAGSDFDFNALTNGSFTVPNDTVTPWIINWGVSPSISNTATAVTFNKAFPNAAFVGIACRQNGTSSLESAAHVNTLTTTGMNVVNSGGTSSPVGYIAIGY